ncbi:hypothetical protein [Methanimicrococcus hongohii]|uniref:hypothetical protein n=1 Tax=Methanimicrococcus hongohii TaxID=3028295 RepID=UPI0029314483|nr:hypothetical protein [Methanimicrococcus sp. Hf6]
MVLDLVLNGTTEFEFIVSHGKNPLFTQNMSSAEFELFIRRERIRQVSIPFASLRESRLAGAASGFFINYCQKLNIPYYSKFKTNPNAVFLPK